MAENLHLNRRARAILEERVIPYAEKLRVGVHRLPCGAVVIDMGIHCPGGFAAARHFVEACLGGLGQLTFGKMQLQEHIVPTARVTLTMPEIAEMSAFIASLKVPWHGRMVSLSGPGRAIKGDAENDHFAHAMPYREPDAEEGVFFIQTTEMPDDELCGQLAAATGLGPEKLLVVAAPTACLVGAVQVCARNVEQVLPTLVDRGFDVTKVRDAYGITPIISVVDDEKTAYGRVNDCLIYGQESVLYVDCEDGEIEKMLPDIPFSKNTDIYGTPFQELFARCGNDWVQVPRDWDAPCRVVFFNTRTGSTFAAGRIGYEVLEGSFMGEGVVL